VIIDTNRRTTEKLACLHEEGVRSIIRYYARSTGQPEKRLTRAEAEAIIASGKSLGVVHQAGGASASSFSREMGKLDAAYAFNYAIETIGQPADSAIYFAVDFDCDAQQIASRVVPHFEAINQENDSGRFARRFLIGGYGNGLVLETLLGDGLIEHAWLSQSLGHRGSREFKRTDDWTLFQKLPSRLCGIGVDVDVLNPARSGFGQFDHLDEPGGAGSVPDSPTQAQFRTTASSGLRLRSGPGTDFDVIQLLPPGTVLTVMSRSGDWAIVDVNGNGLADGAVHSAFLAPVA
jgi:hypothetical protein